MDPQFDELARKVTEAIQQLEPRLVDKIANQVEQRLEHRMQVHFERMEDLVKRTAEGYGATLDSIDRRLDRLEQTVKRSLAR